MPFDGAALHTIAHELHAALRGGRVDKVHQISKEQLRITIRTRGGAKRLLMSAAADSARIHLTTTPAVNPASPPMFCMLLRKHLSGGIIHEIRQVDMERIVELHIDARDELGREARYVLRHEIMGKHSNIILCQNEVIIDAIKRVDEDRSRVRQIMPAYPYEAPPKQDKLDPMMMDDHAFRHLLLQQGNEPCAKALSHNLMGLSIQSARYLGGHAADMDSKPVILSGSDLDALIHQLDQFYTQLRSHTLNGYLLRHPDTRQVMDFMLMHIAPAADADIQPYDSASELVDDYYSQKELAAQLKQQTANLMQSLKIIVKRTRRKLQKQEDTLRDSTHADMYKLYGELLTAYQAQVPKGAAQVELLNYYSEHGEMVTIPLDPEKSANVNAQKYYKKYQKLHRAQQMAQTQVIETQAELNYLESMEHAILQCGDLGAAREIQDEFIAQGYVKKHVKKDRRKFESSKPRHYRSADGHDIYIGRNNKQNDELTMRFARGEDMWLHTQKIPGSHVIIKARDGQVSKQALNDGILLAAYYSKAQSSSNVPVDYTLRKNIKKPNGAKPGYVIYSTHATATVTPALSRIRQLDEVE